MKKKAFNKLEDKRINKELLRGTVSVFNKTLGLLIDKGKIRFRIPIEEIEAYQQVEDDNYSHLTSREVIFIIKEIIPEDNTIIASRKEAQQMVYPEIYEALQTKEPMDATLTHIMSHGAYLDIKGISVFLKNTNYSEDASGIADDYKPGDTMSVVFHKISDKNNIHVTVPKKVKKESSLRESDIEVGSTAMGTVTGIHPTGIFVTIMAGVTVLCKNLKGELENYPLQEYKTPVSIVITGKKPVLDEEDKPIPDKYKFSGAIMKIIS